MFGYVGKSDEDHKEVKFPVREPDGTLNGNAVHAAAAALAGARGGVKASPEKKHKAANGHKPYTSTSGCVGRCCLPFLCGN